MTGSTPFVRQLSAEDARALVDAGKRMEFAAGQTIFHAGAAGNDACLILSGQVRVLTTGAGGREVIMAQRGPGDLVGEMAAVGGHRRTASAVALEPAEVGMLSGPVFMGYLKDHPSALLVLTRMLIGRLAEADRDRIELATRDSVGRLAHRLLELAGDRAIAEANAPAIAVSQEELARWIGATRETVVRALILMRQLGWVATEHRTITLLNPEALRERCAG